MITDYGVTEVLATMNQTSDIKTKMFNGSSLGQIKGRYM